MSKAARRVDRRVRNMTGDARLYYLSEPLEGNTYVIVSAIDERGTGRPYAAHETYIFGANAHGKVTDWGQLRGSYQGGMDHEAALRRAGYEVTE